jgi:hypothetical protein
MTTPNEDNIFTRLDIYKMLIRDIPYYRGSHDYYSLERYLAAIYNCDCTDCEGEDFSRKCAIEQNFFKKYGLIRNANMV